MMNQSKSVMSFTSADAFPAKLLQDLDIIRCIKEEGMIPPVHVQLTPTNRCNIQCTFCSCAEEDRSLEMSLDQVNQVLAVLHPRYTKAITITGGGEPLLFPYIGYLIDELFSRGIKIGLVTNGTLLHQLPKNFSKVTWCRVSYGDDRDDFQEKGVDTLVAAVRKFPGVDWAFSYVVSATPYEHKIKHILSLANLLQFTHVRFVPDLLQTNAVNMVELQLGLQPWIKEHVVIPVIFQRRQTWTKGGDCRICYLKPVIGPDMNVYACCGVQYAFKTPSKKLPEELCLGPVTNLPNIIKNQSLQPFAGTKHCVRCYYSDYNDILNVMCGRADHSEFI